MAISKDMLDLVDEHGSQAWCDGMEHGGRRDNPKTCEIAKAAREDLLAAIEKLEVDAALGRQVRAMEKEADKVPDSHHLTAHLDLRVYCRTPDLGYRWCSGIGNGIHKTPEEALTAAGING